MKIKELFMTLPLILFVLMNGCKKDEYKAIVGVCPIVVSTIPVNGAVGVPLNQVISATFNEKMNAATITSSTFTVIDATKSPAVVITGAIAYSGMTAFLTPSSPLLPKTTYTGRVTTAARDLMGNALQTDYVWTFSTDNQPTVTSNPPDKAVDVPLGKIVVLTFNVPMDTLSFKSPASTITINQGIVAVPGKFTYTLATATFTPTSNLAPFTVYTGTVSKSVKNALGTPMAADYVFSFTTIPQLSLSSNPVLGGTTSGAGTFAQGSTVTAVATANTGYSFLNWTNGATVVSTSASYQFAMAGNKTLVANFTLNTYVLNVTAVNGTVVKNPNLASYTSGATVQLTAIPNAGYSFTSWSGDATGIINPVTIIMNSNKAVTANFTAIPGSAPLFSTKFGIFGGTAGMTNQGTLTKIVGGDIGTIATGTSAITGFHDSNADIYTETGSNIGGVSGLILSCTNSTTGPNSAGVNAANCDAATVGLNAIQAAYNALAGMPVSGVLLPANLSGLTVAAGVYKAPAGSFMIQDGLPGPAGDLTLSGTATDVWVFQMSTSLTVGGPGAAFPRSVILTGGALAKNVYWQVGSAATINAGGGGTMVGTIISMAGVAISTSGNVNIVTLNGRALSLVASVTVVNTIINVPAP